MSAGVHQRVCSAGQEAGEIAALAAIVASALMIDPDQATTGEAIDGLSRMARTLSDRLFDIAELAD